MNTIIVLSVFFGLALASMLLSNVNILLSAPIAATAVSILLRFLKRRQGTAIE